MGDDVESMSWDEYRAKCDALSEELGEWQGIPVPIPDFKLVLHDRHPRRDAVENFNAAIDEANANPDGPLFDPDEVFVCTGSDVDENAWEVINHWIDWQRNREVHLLRRQGKYRALVVPRSPDGAMDRLTFWLSTMGASDAWDLDAEHTARAKLRAMVNEHQWRHYDLTGSFIETSPRSRLTYMFRRSRPTIAMTPRWKHPEINWMRCLAVLCLHPVGFYDKTWAGCMVPTDDVLAHLLMMRGDEAYFWRKANQHESTSPNAGL